MMASSSSSSSSQNSHRQHDVFISFRGPDVRSNLLSHLRRELPRKEINFYVDDKDLESGQEISPALLRAIEESLISLIIFSENYADSPWCLEELAKIMECKQRNKQIVVPVFYNIVPNVVRHQKGSYEDAFKKHDKRCKEEKVRTWRTALRAAASISGICYSDSKDEAELVEKIVKSLSRKLYSLGETRNLVGMHKRVEELQSLMHQNSHDVCVIGVWGKGGIGKTTLAAEVFKRFRCKYEGFCFLENVREKSQKSGGVLRLRREIFSTLLKVKDLYIDNSNGLPPNAEINLRRTKILLILDDVDDSSQLKRIVGKLDCFQPGSVIIITTKNENVLRDVAKGTTKGVAIKTYKVDPLTFEEGLELFNLHAFKENCTDKELLALSRKVMEYARELPLVVKVLGSSLCGKNKQEWKGQLEKLENMRFEEIHKVLRLSYDTLDSQQKSMFLYIACHLKGFTKDQITHILNACSFPTVTGLKVLKDNALITWTSEESIVSMHNLIEEMGKEIVREESKQDLGKYRHLWESNEICDVLRNDKGSKYIESITLYEITGGSNLLLSPQVFSKMHKLKILTIFLSYRAELAHIELPQGLHSFPDELRFLCWPFYPLRYLPITCAKNFVELQMRPSNLRKLWDGWMPLENLKRIDLTGSIKLVKLPDLSSAKNLEKLLLSGCKSLRVLHPYILSLPKLDSLGLNDCTKLTCLRKLKGFSMASESLTNLSLAGTTIKKFLFPIGCLGRLEFLSLAHCKSLTNLPSNLVDLKSLRYLFISGCQQLQSLPQLPSSIQVLEASYCTSLKTVQFSFMDEIPFNNELVKIGLRRCKNLDGQSRYAIQLIARPNLTSYAHKSTAERKKRGDPHGATNEVIYPGREVPKWFKHRTQQGSINFSPHSKFLGFIFCFILPDYLHVNFRVKWCWNINDGEILEGEPLKFTPDRFEYRPSNGAGFQVCICYAECSGILNEKIEESIDIPQNLTLSLFFSFMDELCQLVRILRCGVQPIYAKDDDDDEHDHEEEEEYDDDEDKDELDHWSMIYEY